jgi:hypothetical protein
VLKEVIFALTTPDDYILKNILFRQCWDTGVHIGSGSLDWEEVDKEFYCKNVPRLLKWLVIFYGGIPCTILR